MKNGAAEVDAGGEENEEKNDEGKKGDDEVKNDGAFGSVDFDGDEENNNDEEKAKDGGPSATAKRDDAEHEEYDGWEFQKISGATRDRGDLEFMI